MAEEKARINKRNPSNDLIQIKNLKKVSWNVSCTCVVLMNKI